MGQKTCEMMKLHMCNEVFTAVEDSSEIEKLLYVFQLSVGVGSFLPHAKEVLMVLMPLRMSLPWRWLVVRVTNLWTDSWEGTFQGEKHRWLLRTLAKVLHRSLSFMSPFLRTGRHVCYLLPRTRHVLQCYSFARNQEGKNPLFFLHGFWC